MASRDSQSMQAIVIVLVLAVIGLGVGLILVNNAKKTARSSAKSANESASSAQQTAREAQEEANRYKEMMGFSEANTFDSLQKSFEEDMKNFGETFADTDKFYSPILQNVSEENRKLERSEVEAKEQLGVLKSKLLAVEDQKEEQVKEAQAAASKAEQDLASERTKFNDQYKDITAEKEDIAGQLEEQRSKFDEQNARYDAQINELETKITQLGHSNEILRSRQVDPDPIAQPADGRVTWVSQRYGQVWIDLGEADYLRPQINFSVFGADENDPIKAVKKGSIEVTRIVSAHMAEARISGDDPTKPIIPGDRIYSQVWDRGRKVGFAITGFIDFDDDGKSDLKQLQDIIRINNGRVDSVLSDAFKVEGEMTVHTRYLILGEYSDDPIKSEPVRTGWDAMSEQADTLGVDTITMEEFLSLMGWHPGSRTVKLGRGARPDDFKARHPRDDLPPNTGTTSSDKFRKRTPQPSY